MMKNMTTKDFCRKFRACKEGTRFALHYDTMRDCYAALLAGEAGDNSAEWAIWTVTREGVMSDRNLRMFAVRCARRVQHLLMDERSVDALDVAERYAFGQADDNELSSSLFAASAAARVIGISFVTWHAAQAAAHTVLWDATSAAAWTVWYAASVVKHTEQLAILAEFGNPFLGGKNDDREDSFSSDGARGSRLRVDSFYWGPT